MSTDLIQTLATDWAEQDSGTKVATCRHTPLRTYRATRLPHYTPARIGKQRGTRNGAPRHSWSLLLFSPERFLNLFIALLIILIHPDVDSTARGSHVGESAIVGYWTACLSCCWTTNLHAYRATRLPDYTPARIFARPHDYLPLLSAGECDSIFLKLSRRRLSSSSS